MFASPIGYMLVTNELVEVQDCRKITNRSRGIYRIYPNLIKENLRMGTCNQLDLQTLGSQPIIIPKNLPDHCLITRASDSACSLILELITVLN